MFSNTPKQVADPASMFPQYVNAMCRTHDSVYFVPTLPTSASISCWVCYLNLLLNNDACGFVRTQNLPLILLTLYLYWMNRAELFWSKSIEGIINCKDAFCPTDLSAEAMQRDESGHSVACTPRSTVAHTLALLTPLLLVARWHVWRACTHLCYIFLYISTM